MAQADQIGRPLLRAVCDLMLRSDVPQTLPPRRIGVPDDEIAAPPGLNVVRTMPMGTKVDYAPSNLMMVSRLGLPMIWIAQHATELQTGPSELFSEAHIERYYPWGRARATYSWEYELRSVDELVTHANARYKGKLRVAHRLNRPCACQGRDPTQARSSP